MGVKTPISWGLVLNCDRSTVKHALQNTQNDCYQWLSNSAPNSISKRRGEKEMGKEEPGGRGRGRGGTGNRGMEGKGFCQAKGGGWRRGGEEREGKKSKNTPSVNFCLRPCMAQSLASAGASPNEPPPYPHRRRAENFRQFSEWLPF